MANILYRKQKQQISYDGGATWNDTGEYRVGSVLENPSNCTSSDSKQCRWVELDASEGYYCDSTTYTKYSLKVEECSENGLIWSRTGNQEKGDTTIETNSCDCGYKEYKWNLIPDRYECATDSFAKYGVEVYQIGCGDRWENVEPYQERLTEKHLECYSLDCGMLSNEIVLTVENISDTESNKVSILYTFENDSGNPIFSNSYIHDGVIECLDIDDLLIENTLTLQVNDYLPCNVTGIEFNDGNIASSACLIGNNVIIKRIDKMMNTKYFKKFKSMFENLISVEYIDTTYINTENALSMDNMFSGCQSLSSLDLSNFNTSNVISMGWMFYNCFSLECLNLSHFNTSNVTNMNGMFSTCTNLKYLNLSGWDLTNIGGEYNNGNNTYNGSLSYMFYDCSSLEYLDLSGWDLSHLDATYLEDMFFINGGGLKNITLNVILNDVNYETYELINTALSKGQLNYRIITNTIEDNYFDLGCESLYIDSLSSNHITVNINGIGYQCYRFNDYDLTYFTNDTFVSAKNFLIGNQDIVGLDKMFDTSNVTDMSYMFYNNLYLNYVNTSCFNTSNVIDMSYMFYNCNSLTELDVRHWNISNVTNYENMFYECTALTTLYVNPDTENWWNDRLIENNIRENVTLITNKVDYVETTITDFNVIYDGDEVVDYNVIPTPKVKATLNMKVNTEYCGVNEYEYIVNIDDFIVEYSPSGANITTDERIVSGTVFINNEKIDTFTFIQKGVRNNNYISFQYKQWDASSIDVRFGSITLNDTNYSSTLGDLIEVNVSNGIYQWNLNVKDLGIETLYKIKFNGRTRRILSFALVDKLTSTKNMFTDCGKYLPQTDIQMVVDVLDMSNVTDSSYMFSMCYNLTTLDLSGWNTSNVTTMESMFNTCSGLTSLDLSNFDTSKVTSTESMFGDCSSLTSLDLSNWNTSKFDNVYSMFENCSSLQTLNLSNWDLTNATVINNPDVGNTHFLDGCDALTTIYCYGCNEDTINKLNEAKPTNATLVY